jgi:hypothetical protein
MYDNDAADSAFDDIPNLNHIIDRRLPTKRVMDSRVLGIS